MIGEVIISQDPYVAVPNNNSTDSSSKCEWCFRSGNLKKCSACHVVWYCGSTCQVHYCIVLTTCFILCYANNLSDFGMYSFCFMLYVSCLTFNILEVFLVFFPKPFLFVLLYPLDKLTWIEKRLRVC